MAVAGAFAIGGWLVLGTVLVSLSLVHSDALGHDAPLLMLLCVAGLAMAEAAPFWLRTSKAAADSAPDPLECRLVEDFASQSTYVACLTKPDDLACEMDWSTVPPSWLCKV